MNNKIFLPGTDKQLKMLLSHLDITGMTVLVIGTGSEEIAALLKEKGADSVIIIVEDNDSLLYSRLILSRAQGIQVRMMEFDNTDFLSPKFDLVYAQASISNKRRNKIVKEIKRILKPEGYLCVGENINISSPVPAFVQDIWDTSSIIPLTLEDADKYYRERNFKVYNEFDLSSTLNEFYKMGKYLLEDNVDSFTDNEKSYYKKILKQINHESNIYLKLGGDAYMGFRMFILRKGKE